MTADNMNESAITNKDILFLLSFGLYFIYCGFQTSFFAVYFSNDNIFKIVIVMCMLLLVIKEASAKINRTAFLLIGLFVLFSVFVLKNGEGLGQKSLFFAIVYIISARDVSLKKILSLSAALCAFILVVVVLSSELGIIMNFTDRRGDGTLRNPLGFRWVLFASTFYFEFVSIIVYLHKSKLRLITILMLGFIGWWLYYETDSRICFVLTETVIIIALLDKFRQHIHAENGLVLRTIIRLLTVSFIVSATFAIVVTVLYNPDNELMSDINGLLANRLGLGQASLNQYGVSLFGIRGIEWIGHGRDAFGNAQLLEYNYVDCGYIVILQRYGVLFTVFWLVCNTFTLKNAYKHGDYYLIFIMSLIAIHCIIDDLQIALHYNVFWLANAMLFPKLQTLLVGSKKNEK